VPDIGLIVEGRYDASALKKLVERINKKLLQFILFPVTAP
jgi:5S rRNA maturation endonuclease (ribonuclease M5)